MWMILCTCRDVSLNSGSWAALDLDVHFTLCG